MAYIERERRGEHRQVFCETECWVRFEPYSCACPDNGSVHTTARGKPCPELVKRAIPAGLVGAVRCTCCGYAVT
jgi:hypothetical protein